MYAYNSKGQRVQVSVPERDEDITVSAEWLALIASQLESGVDPLQVASQVRAVL